MKKRITIIEEEEKRRVDDVKRTLDEEHKRNKEKQYKFEEVCKNRGIMTY